MKTSTNTSPMKTSQPQKIQKMDVLAFFRERMENEPELYDQFTETSLQLSIADQVWYWRKLRGLSQSELAEKANTKQESIARLESQGEIASIELLLRIMKALDICLVMEFLYDNTARHLILCGREIDELGEEIGAALRSIRLERGYSQAELAGRIGTKQPAIARIERGRSLPSLGMMSKLLEALDVQYNISLKPLDVFRYAVINEARVSLESLKDDGTISRPLIYAAYT